MSGYTIKRTSLITWDIIDWEEMRVIQAGITSLSKAEEIVKELEESQ